MNLSAPRYRENQQSKGLELRLSYYLDLTLELFLLKKGLPGAESLVFHLPLQHFYYSELAFQLLLLSSKPSSFLPPPFSFSPPHLLPLLSFLYPNLLAFFIKVHLTGAIQLANSLRALWVLLSKNLSILILKNERRLLQIQNQKEYEIKSLFVY